MKLAVDRSSSKKDILSVMAHDGEHAQIVDTTQLLTLRRLGLAYFACNLGSCASSFQLNDRSPIFTSIGIAITSTNLFLLKNVNVSSRLPFNRQVVLLTECFLFPVHLARLPGHFHHVSSISAPSSNSRAFEEGKLISRFGL